MKIIYFISYLLKGLTHKFLGKINDWSCKMYVTCDKGTSFSMSASVGNLTKDISKISIGKHSMIEGKLKVFSYDGSIKIGDYVYIGANSNVWSGEEVIIGNNVLISHNVNIMDTNSHEIDTNERIEKYKLFLQEGYPKNKGSVVTNKIKIEDYVWISFGVTILKGITIGEGAIIGANSLISKNVEAYTFVAGNPAQIIKYLK